VRVGIHQANFFPHFGYFYKMSMCDKFVILSQVQFEKNGFQNRYFLQGKQKWVTNPVCSGLEPIFTKQYTNGVNLEELNVRIINSIKDILSIKCEIVKDVVTESRSTQRLIDNLNHYGATAYVTNPNAKNKYLDEEAIRQAGIDIIYSSHQNDKLNILEMFELYGIEGTRNQLWKQKLSNVSANGKD